MDYFMANLARKTVRKFVSFLLIFALIFGQLSTPILVLAQEATASADVIVEEPTATDSGQPVDPTPPSSPTPIATESATPTPSPTPSITEVTTVPISIDTQSSPRKLNTNLKLADKNNDRRKSRLGNYAEGEALVKFKKNRINLKNQTDQPKASLFEEKHNLEVIDEVRDANMQVVKTDKTTTELVNELKKDPDVEIVEPNYVVKLTSMPNDPSLNKLWGMHNTGQAVNGISGKADSDIDAPEAWDLEKTEQVDTLVAVLDTGVAYDHPDLAANMWTPTSCKDENGIGIAGGCPNHGWDVGMGDNDPYDDYGHGTHVSGTIAGAGNDGKGIIGISSKNNIKIMAVKVNLSGTEEIYVSSVIKGINFAKHNGAKVINASFGDSIYSQLMKDAIDAFPGLFVAAAGNYGQNTDSSRFYPSGFDSPNIISVAATDQNDNLASFSNYGSSSVDVGAPGVNIYSSLPGEIPDFEYQEIDFQAFEEVTPPAIPTGYTKTGDWGTKVASNSANTAGGGLGISLFGDVNHTPYKNNSDDIFTSPKFNLANNDLVEMSFLSRCDTQYEFNYTDYVVLEMTKDGQNFEYVAKWDEYDLDYFSGNPQDPVGYAEAFLVASIQQQYLTDNFQYRFIWHTNGSISGDLGLGCFVDNITLTAGKKIGSTPMYDYWAGTSMATPHVVGQAAMLISYSPNLTPAQIKETILNSGDSIPALAGKTVSGKRINLFNALQNQTKSSNADLSNLTTNKGVLTPSFSPAIASYSATVASNDNTIRVTPVVSDIKSSIKVNGVAVVSGQESSDIALNIGTNLISIVVTAEDNSTKTYTINVTRSAPDITAPVITISPNPILFYYNHDLTFTIDFDDAVIKEYKLNSGDWTNYTGAITVSAEGIHNLMARGTDASGNAGNTKVTFQIDKTAPIISEVKPIVSPTNNSSPTLDINTTEQADVNFAGSCRGQVKSFTITPDGKTFYTVGFNNLSDGTYNDCKVTFRDYAGNVSAPLSVTTFTVDTINPTVTIDSPAENTRVSAVTEVGFGMSGGSTVECSIDNINWISNCNNLGVGSIVQGGGSSVMLGNLQGFSELPEGQFTFYIRLTDDAGNVGQVSRNFIKDTHIPNAPGTPIAQAGPFINASENNFGFLIVVPLPTDVKVGHLLKVYLNSDHESISHPLTQENIDSFTYSFAAGNGTLGEDGVKTFTAKIIDDLGRNSALSAPLTLMLDTHAPNAPVITSVAGDNKINNLEKTGVIIIGTAEANSLVKLSLTDQTNTTSASVKLTNNQTNYSVTTDISTLNDGNITITVTSEDEAGNISSPSTQTVTKDTLIPNLINTSISSSNVDFSKAKTGDIITLAFVSNEQLTNIVVKINGIAALVSQLNNTYTATHMVTSNDPEDEVSFEISYADSVGNIGNTFTTTTDSSKVIVDKTAPLVTGVENKVYNTNVTPIFNEGIGLLNGSTFNSGTTISQDGVYTLVVTDQTGNSTTINFSIDKTAPVVIISKSPDKSLSNTDYIVTISYGDSVIKEYRLDTNDWTTYDGPITVSTKGLHAINARGTDAAGNTANADSVTFTIDKTAPIITGVEDGKYYNANVTPEFNDGTATLNGEAFVSGTEISSNGVYALIAVDAATNSSTVTFIIDKTAPELNMIRIPDTNISNTNYTLAIEYSDTYLDSKQYRLDNGSWIDYSDPITVTSEGNHEFEAKLTDLAGNVTQKQVSFKINKTIPEALTDSYFTVKNTPITIDSSNLIANDKDLGGDLLSVSEYTNAVNGQAEISGTGVTFFPTDDFIGTGSFKYTLSDGLNTTQGTAYIVVTPEINDNQTPIQPIVNIATDQPQVVVVNTLFDTVINVPNDVINASLDLSNLISSNSATLNNRIDINANTSIGNINVSLPDGLTLSADSTWDGTVNLPTILDNSTVSATPSAGMTATTTSVIEIGFGDTRLNLSKAARILIPGKAGQLAAYSQAGVVTAITTVCAADNQTNADALADGGDCKIDVGADLVIWTKHFTKFVTYTQTAIPSQGSNNSSNNSSSPSSPNYNSEAPICSDSKPSSAPKLLSAIATGANEVTLTWSKALDPVTYYLVAYGTKSGKIEYGNPNVGDKNTTSYTVKGLSGGTNYYFKIRAGNNCMPGEFSNELKAVANGSKVATIATDFKPGVLSKEISQPQSQPQDIPSHSWKRVEVGLLSKFINFIIGIFNHK